MSRKRIIIPALTGALIGFFALHSYSMLVFGAMERHDESGVFFGHLARHLRDMTAAFEPGMLHMGIPYAMLGASVGLFFGFWREAERRREETEKGALAAEALVSAIDAKSPWTKGHSENVMDYAVKVAVRMGLGRAETGNLKLAALLHDIGKIGTYDALLDKRGKLTEEEFAIVKRHPEAGADVLKPIKQLKDIIPAIRHHHERWDGKGYPDGLKGKEIPALARVVSVADAYEAANELKRWKGIKFDPDVVDAFLEVLKEKKEAA